MNPNFERLETVIEATQKEALDQFCMRLVYTPQFNGCGTAGCLIGNYNAYMKRPSCLYGRESYAIRDWEHFGIDEGSYYWLFDSGFVMISRRKTQSVMREVSKVNKSQAISRVQKFIAYFKRKQEIFAAYYDWRTSERARRQEGNWNVHLTVKERMQELTTQIAV